MSAQVFGATFSPVDARSVRSRVPQIPGQSTFNSRDARFVAQGLPPYQAATQSRIAMGARQAGFDFGNNGGILPRAIHALNNREQPSNMGAIVAQRQAQRAVMGGFYGVAGLGASAGCTSTGAQVAQGTLAAGGQILTSVSTTLTQQNVTSATTAATPTAATGSTTPTGSTSTTASTATAITGGILSAISAIYTGVCTARTGTVPPGTTTGTQVGAATSQLISDISAARASGSTSTTPAAGAAAAAATNPNSATGAQNVNQPAPASDNTLLYVGIGAAALVGIALVLR